MTRQELIAQIRMKESFLCVGLDLDLQKVPQWLSQEENQWFTFNKAIIDATRDLCVAYKPNWAFYEALGEPGMRVLQQTIEYIGKDHLIIADAKRGDIGNTSNKYSEAIFDQLNCDAITVAPYMGSDSLEPFKRTGKWLIVLALTSNPGSRDYQMLKLADGKYLFESVLERCAADYGPEEGMFVVGATHPEMLATVRKICPDHFLLIPGVGAQGGSLEKVAQFGLNKDVGLLVNSSRGIIYAGGQNQNYKSAIRSAASQLQSQMAQILAS